MMTSFGLPPLSLVVGGAASGKSAYAERLVIRSGLKPVHIATSQPFEAEVRNKIFRHQAMRGANWQTIEAPFDLSSAIYSAETGQVLLIDCLTAWLTNHFLAEHDLPSRVQALIETLLSATVPVVIVTNEIGQGIVPEDPHLWELRQAHGQLNQSIAAAAEIVVMVTAGIPLALKGNLPELDA